jgi:hypothetical protein
MQPPQAARPSAKIGHQEIAELYLMMLEKRWAKVGLELPAITPGYPHTLA